jgi:hypothetical protein
MPEQPASPTNDAAINHCFAAFTATPFAAKVYTTNRIQPEVRIYLHHQIILP